MKLKQFMGTSQIDPPTVKVSFNNGRILFDKATSGLLGLKECDFLAFFQDEENPNNWYFTKAKGRGSFKLTSEKGRSNIFFYSAAVARGILKTWHEKPVVFPLSEKIVDGKYWEILTEKLK